MAMANPKRVPSSPGGADGGALHARQDAAQALEQARPDFGGAPGLPDRGGKPAGGRAIEDYDVLADLRRIVAGEGDDACEARVDAWIHENALARIDERIDERIREQMHERIREQMHERIREQIDEQLQDADDGIIEDLVRAYCLPPIPESP